MSYTFFQQYWWFLISLLGGLLVFLLFVQGGQTLLSTIAKNETERKMLINSLGRKWEYTFTTLVTFGGAFFASFPLFYSTSFGGAYWVWIIILACFVLQAVSYEFRTKAGNLLGQRTYDTFLLINGLLGTLLLGTAVATFFTSSEFTINKVNLTNPVMPVVSTWDNPLHGLEAALNIRNLFLGLGVFFLARTLASLYFMNNICDKTIFTRARKQVLFNGIPFLLFFLSFLIWTLVSDGFAVNPGTGEIEMQAYKYLNNFLEMPIVLIVFLIGIVLLLFGLIRSQSKHPYTKGIWFAGTGTVLTVVCLFLIAGYNNTAYYPSVTNLDSSLTIYNSSSSEFTLKVMSVVSLFVPIVLAYIYYAWRSLDKKKIDKTEIEDKRNHVY